MLTKEIHQKRKIDRHGSQELWTKIMIEDIQWFPLQVIILHTAYTINNPEEHLQ